MSADGRDGADLSRLKGDIDAVEQRVAREFDPGARALVVAILVFVLLVGFVLPHFGSTRGFTLLFGSDTATADGVSLPSRVFAWLAVVFSIGFSMLALLTRRWAVAWVALAGSAVASVLGMLSVWSRQTAAATQPGPGIGLIISWIAVVLLTFHWARVVWSRTALQLAAEEERRQAVAEQQRRGLLDEMDHGRDTGRGSGDPA